jgi:hypothetical protein
LRLVLLLVLVQRPELAPVQMLLQEQVLVHMLAMPALVLLRT